MPTQKTHSAFTRLTDHHKVIKGKFAKRLPDEKTFTDTPPTGGH